MKQYPIVCKSCQGTGRILSPNWNGYPQQTSEPQVMVCPACKGTGSVIVTEM